MKDENIRSNPYNNGDKIILELVVTDADLSWELIGKALHNKIDTSHLGLELTSVSPWIDRYKDNIHQDLRYEISKELNKCFGNISELLSIKNKVDK